MYQRLVQEEVPVGMGEVQASRMIGLEDVLPMKITWASIWNAGFHPFGFLVQDVYSVLSSPSNLHIWGQSIPPINSLY